MRHQEVPDQPLERLGVRRRVGRVDHRNDGARVGDVRRVPAVAAHDAENAGSHLLACLSAATSRVRGVGRAAAHPEDAFPARTSSGDNDAWSKDRAKRR